MDTARQAAPEIDRLVLGLGGRTMRDHGERLGEIGRGLASLDWLSHVGAFVRAGRLTGELALLRSRYWPVERVLGRLDELEAGGHLALTGRGYAATDRLLPVLDAMQDARAAAAASMWAGHEDDVAVVSRLAAEVAEAASSEHELAVVHRSLPLPSDGFLVMDHRLLTLRFVRNHDHAAAWQAHGLTPGEIVVLSRLWSGEPAGEDVPAALVARGLVAGGSLTDEGVALREAIEDETNARNQRAFDVLSDDSAAELVAALRRLPTA